MAQGYLLEYVKQIVKNCLYLIPMGICCLKRYSSFKWNLAKLNMATLPSGLPKIVNIWAFIWRKTRKLRLWLDSLLLIILLISPRQSQLELRQHIDSLSDDLKKASERQNPPIELDGYVKKLNNAKRRVMLVNNILQNAQVQYYPHIIPNPFENLKDGPWLHLLLQ